MSLLLQKNVSIYCTLLAANLPCSKVFFPNRPHRKLSAWKDAIIVLQKYGLIPSRCRKSALNKIKGYMWNVESDLETNDRNDALSILPSR